ncbi:Glycogen accumulation regulator GarA [compost metagenome]
MARLKVRLRGKTVCDVPLVEGTQYVAGRKEDCDIVLQPEKGISREHFRLSFVNGFWTVEVVSRYGDIIVAGEAQQTFTLDHGVQFSVPPYEFEYLATSAEAPMEFTGARGSVDGEYLPATTGIQETPGSHGADSEEKTVIGVAPTSAYVKIVDSQNETKELIRLEAGDSWVAGRESSCNIYIRDQRVSRRQFEIRKSGANYVILDLGSVNGTLLNGVPVSSSEPVPLKSGDSISVLDNYLYFELHDVHFQSRLEMVNIQPLNPLVVNEDRYDIAAYQGAMPPAHIDPNMMPMPYQQGQYPGPVAPPPSGKFDFKKNRPKIIIGAVVVLLLAYLFSGSNSNQPPVGSTGVVTPGSAADLFAKLQPEQQALVRQRYKDAKNMYMQGKYELAKQEISKIQEVVPDYEDIKEIQRLSEEAMFIQDQKRRQEEIEKARAEAEEKILAQVAICDKKISPTITMEEFEDCISPVLQFNPEHPNIMNLRSQVESLIAMREAKEAERAAYQAQVARLRSIYTKAEQVHKKGRPLDTIAAYEKVLDSKLPDPNGYKGQAQRQISSVRKMMNEKTASFQAEADRLYQSQNLKGAIMALRQARRVDPDNTDLVDKIQRYTGELRKQMMNLYQEGILEESFGNVEGGESKAGAKDKWKKILELDVSDGEYYKKAYIKLKKYGAL